jgi:hypothetical protein
MASMALAAAELAGDRRRPRWTRRRLAVRLALLVPLALLLQGVFAGMTEGYCIIWPSIGTRFAPEYSERGFDAIKPGMTQQQVAALIGQPLGWGYHTAPPGHALKKAGDVVWSYSTDTDGRGGDFAWLSREVVLRDGKVAHTVRWIYYD